MAAAALFLSAAYILLGLLLLTRRLKTPAVDWEPSVSVIVAARNEERNLPACLRALEELDYPPSKLQVILINDASSDATSELMHAFAQGRGNVTAIDLQAGDKRKPGKAGALAAGIEHSSGRVLLITDADCIVPRPWIRGMLRLFTPGTAVVGGLTILEPTSSAWQAIQAIDWLFLLSVASSASRAGLPVSWVGNNLAVRREDYEAVGGYERLPNTLVEDFSLIDAVRRRGRRCCFLPAPETVVRSAPTAGLRDLYRQRRRWMTGIDRAPIFGLGLMAAAFAAHLGLIVAFGRPLLGLAVFAAKAVVDRLLIERTCRLADVRCPKGRFLLFEVYYIAYTLLLPLFMAVDRTVVWKDERYSKLNP